MMEIFCGLDLSLVDDAIVGVFVVVVVVVVVVYVVCVSFIVRLFHKLVG